MKVFALNSSPRTGGRSKTELMLGRLVEGMRDAGAQVEVANLREKNIKSCVGCFTCWTKTPGTCIHRDDMSGELFPKWLASDLVVYATPLYFHTVNSMMSRFRERTLPVAQPFIETSEGKSTHPLRYKVPAAVWLSVCGFPEASEFDALSDYLRRTLHRDAEIWAEIYRPAAESMGMPMFRDVAKDVLDATMQAGRELVKTRKIAPQTMARITQPIGDSARIVDLANLFWRTAIAEGVTPKEFETKGMIPRPDSLESFILVFPFGINREAAGDRRVVLQFRFSGAVNEPCHFTIQKEAVSAAEGTGKNPDVTIETPFDLWMDIITGKADGQRMFMEGRYKVEGDLALMLALFQKKEKNP